jgi:hypothetical protein
MDDQSVEPTKVAMLSLTQLMVGMVPKRVGLLGHAHTTWSLKAEVLSINLKEIMWPKTMTEDSDFSVVLSENRAALPPRTFVKSKKVKLFSQWMSVWHRVTAGSYYYHLTPTGKEDMDKL